MTNLFKTEVLRHLHWILILTFAHFFILYYIFSLGSSFTSGEAAIIWMMAILLLASMFGVLQMKLHKRNNDWVYLLHRPLQPAKIHIALTLAGSALLLLALLLPALLMLVVLQIDGGFGTELRHYQFPVLGATVALTAYGVGQYAVLGASRLAFFALVLMVIFIYQPFGDSERLVTHGLLMIWALVIAHIAFKPDLGRQPTNPAKLLIVELPIIFGCYMVFAMTFGLYVLSQRNSSSLFGNPAPDSFGRMTLLNNREQLRFALDNSDHPDADFLAQQATLGEIIAITTPQRLSYPRRSQLPLRDGKLGLTDSETNTRWWFSHSTMLYVGRDIASNAHTGWLAPDGFHAAEDGIPAERFSSVPLATTKDYLVDDHSIYQIDWQDHRLAQRFTITGDERFSDSLFMSEDLVTIFSDQHLFIFSMPDLLDINIPLTPRAVLEVSSTVDDGNPGLGGIHVMELINGYLVLAFVDAPSSSNVPEFVVQGKAKLQVWRVVPGMAGELIANVPLGSSYSELSQYADLVLAPGARILADAFWGMKLRQSAERTFPVLYATLPLWVMIATLGVCVLSAALTAWLLRNSRLPASVRNFWIVICALTGLPGLLAFLGGHYWRGRESLKLPLHPHNRKVVEASA
ncbi:MAG: hypothetical protein V4628_05020 [Pseudomonadota bacterium]